MLVDVIVNVGRFEGCKLPMPFIRYADPLELNHKPKNLLICGLLRIQNIIYQFLTIAKICFQKFIYSFAT